MSAIFSKSGGAFIMGALTPFYTTLTDQRPFIRDIKTIDASGAGTGLSEVAGTRRGETYRVAVAGNALGIDLFVGDWLVCRQNFTGTPANLNDFDIYLASGGGGGGGNPGVPLNSIQFNSGGSFGGDASLLFDSGTKTINLAGRMNADEYNILPTKTKYVETESDFGDLVSKFVPALGVNADFHELQGDTNYILRNPVTIVNNLTPANGAFIQVSSGNTWNAILTSTPIVAGSPVFFSNGPAGIQVQLDNLQIVNGGASPLSKVFELLGGNRLYCNNIIADFFPTWGTLQDFIRVYFLRSEGIYTGPLLIDLIDCGILDAHDNVFGNIANSNFIRMSGTGSINARISNNLVVNSPTSFFLRIEPTLSAASIILIANNNVSDTSRFYDVSAGGLNQTDSRVSAFSNSNSIASNIVADSFNGAIIKSDGVVTEYADGTGNYSVPEAGISANTKFVTQESDFGPIVSRFVTALGENVDFHLLADDTNYVTVQGVTLTAGLTVDPGVKCSVTTNDFENNILSFNLSEPTSPVVFSETLNSSSAITFKNIKIFNGGGNGDVFDVISAAGQGRVFIENCNIVGFPASDIGSVVNIASIEVRNSTLQSNFVGLSVANVQSSIFHDNRISNISGSTPGLIFSRTSAFPSISIMTNVFPSSSQPAIRLDSSLSGATISKCFIVNNDSNNPLSFFDTSAGGLDQSDPNVFSFSNRGVNNGNTISDSFNGAIIKSDGVVTEYADGTGNYSVPSGAANTLFVTQESDLPDTVSIDLGAPFGTADYHSISTDTKIVLLNEVTVANGILATSGANVSITSGNKDSAKLISDLSVTTGPLLLSSVGASLTTENIKIESTTVGTDNLFIFGISGTTQYTLRNSSFTGFAKLGQITSTGVGRVDIINCRADPSTGGLLLITPQNVRVINSVINYGGSGSTFEFSGNSQTTVQIIGNTGTNSNGKFLKIGDQFASLLSVFEVDSNLVTPDSLFDKSAGTWTPLNRQVVSTNNTYNSNSYPCEVLRVQDTTNQIPAIGSIPLDVKFSAIDASSDYMSYTANTSTFLVLRAGIFSVRISVNIARTSSTGTERLSLRAKLDTGSGFNDLGNPTSVAIEDVNLGSPEYFTFLSLKLNVDDEIKFIMTNDQEQGVADIGLYPHSTINIGTVPSTAISWVLENT